MIDYAQKQQCLIPTNKPNWQLMKERKQIIIITKIITRNLLKKVIKTYVREKSKSFQSNLH